MLGRKIGIKLTMGVTFTALLVIIVFASFSIRGESPYFGGVLPLSSMCLRRL